VEMGEERRNEKQKIQVKEETENKIKKREK
jgi:hypothetical protein